MSNTPLRVIFAGTPEFAIPSLQALIDHPAVEVVAVYSQPDRKAGRGRKLMPTPIKQAALENNIAVQTPINFKDNTDKQILAGYQADLMVVAAYGLLLPRSVLDIPTYGCINVHASLLPRWRGAAPVQAAILTGDVQTGVGIMRMEKGLDTGGIYCEKTITIDSQINAGELTNKLAELGAEALMEAIEKQLYKTNPEPQSTEGVTYAHKIQKADALIDWQRPAAEIQRHIRAYWPWPGAFSFYNNKRIKIAASEALNETVEAEPGTMVAMSDDGITVACADQCLQITLCQPEGKTLSAAKQWLGYFQVGSVFTSQPS
jgi:methionyl-tRNA formyltransferase